MAHTTERTQFQYLPSQEDDEGTVPQVQMNFDERGNLFLYQSGEEVLIDAASMPAFLAFLQGGEPR